MGFQATGAVLAANSALWTRSVAEAWTRRSFLMMATCDGGNERR